MDKTRFRQAIGMAIVGLASALAGTIPAPAAERLKAANVTLSSRRAQTLR